MSNDDIGIRIFDPEDDSVYSYFSSSRGDARGLEIPNPIPGIWKVEVYGKSPKESGAYYGQITLLPTGLPEYPSDMVIDNTIGAGGINEHGIFIEEPLSFVVFWLDSDGKSLDFRLSNPYGTEVRQATHEGNFKILDIPYPYSGEWTAKVYGEDIEEEINYKIHVYLVPFQME